MIPAAFVTQSFVVNKASQTITFTPVTDKEFGTAPFNLTASSTSALPVTYTYISGPALLSGNQVTLTGLGTVTVSAMQAGDTNYLAATTVVRDFCVRVFALTSISGPQYVCPGQTATYKINNIPGLSYNWRLSDGTTFSSLDDSVNITWGASGSKTLIVSGSGPCGAASANDSLVVNIITAITPGAVTNMLPADGTTGLLLPLTLSWFAGSNALDL
ncbi:MAG: hypothetical protein WDO16_17815 [Bacteroidota bacterium]